MVDFPPFVLAEREALLAEIHEAFDGVSREGGVSWSESQVIDMYGSPKDRAEARATDRDRRWQDLIDDPKWDYECGIGGWSFLDAIGFRYYLPVIMVLTAQKGWDLGINYHLCLPPGDLRGWTHDKWSLLNLRQRLGVKRFLQYMWIVSTAQEEKTGNHDWYSALESYWGNIPADEVT